MIHGIVNANLEATIRLHVAGPNGQRQEIAAIIDTGYNGALSLPTAMVTALALPPSASRIVTLGDASQRVLAFYTANIHWEEQVRLGPERWYLLLQTVMGLVQEVLHHYAGTLALATSEGFTAVFGMPMAQEDHARRAVVAALELRQRLYAAPALRTLRVGEALALSMGLHSGLVVVGGLGQAPQQLATAVGTPLHLARQHKEHGNKARALHQLGVVQAHADPLDTAQAEAYYQQALALAEELGMRPLQARCHHGLGTLYARRGRREQARTALATAIELYRAMEMTFWLPQAEATLAQIGRAEKPEGGVP